MISGVLDLSPDPQHAIRWLDLRVAPGGPATRIGLEQRSPAPDITVTTTTASPGELLADVIAARVLALASDFPQETPGQLAARSADCSRMSPAGSVSSWPRYRRPATTA